MQDELSALVEAFPKQVLSAKSNISGTKEAVEAAKMFVKKVTDFA